MSEIQNLILSYVSVKKTSGTGFYELVCPLCHDYKVRAGFKFDSNTVGYNCFNCNTKGKHTVGTRINDNFKKILIDFNIPEIDILKAVGKDVLYKPTNQTIKTVKKTPNIELPEDSYKLTELIEYRNEVTAIDKCFTYLENRKIDYNSYPFFYSFKYDRHIIIPYYDDHRLYFWKGRNIYGDKKRFTSSHNVEERIFNMNELTRFTNEPLYICEGEFNTLSIGSGIAISGASMSGKVIDRIKKVDREKIVLIDKDKNGFTLGELAISLGWSISFFEEKDANDCLVKYNKLYMLYQIKKNKTKGIQAKVMINILKGKVYGSD